MNKMTAFNKAWGVLKSPCDICKDDVPLGTGAHIPTIEGRNFHWVCDKCAELYASDDEAFQDMVAQVRRER